MINIDPTSITSRRLPRPSLPFGVPVQVVAWTATSEAASLTAVDDLGQRHELRLSGLVPAMLRVGQWTARGGQGGYYYMREVCLVDGVERREDLRIVPARLVRRMGWLKRHVRERRA